MLLEEKHDGVWTGYTPEYIAVSVPDCPACRQGALLNIRLTADLGDAMVCELV